MHRNKDNTTRRNADIFQEYVTLFEQNEMRLSAIYSKLEEKYYLDRSSIERIIWKAKKAKRNDLTPGAP